MSTGPLLTISSATMTKVIRKKQNGPKSRGLNIFWFRFSCFLIFWKLNPLASQNSYKCHCLCFWLFLKTKSSKETWAPLFHKENNHLASIGDDLNIAGFTWWFLTSIWRTQSYQSGPAPPSSRQAPAKHRANPGGPESQCSPSLGWRQQASSVESASVESVKHYG